MSPKPKEDTTLVDDDVAEDARDKLLPPWERPLPPHPLAMNPPVDTTESFEDFERKTLKDWGYKDAETAYFGSNDASAEGASMIQSLPWRKNLKRAWEEATADTLSGKTTPWRLAMLKHQIKPSTPGADEKDGILGRQIAKAEFLRQHPEVLDIDIRPVVLIGQNRTGTTFLHRLLALDNETTFRSAKAWELTTPLPPPQRETYDSGDSRQEIAKITTKIFDDLFPDLKHCHELDLTKPEECLFAWNDDLPEFANYINVPGIDVMNRVMDTNEMEYVYESYKKTLQILSYKYPAPSSGDGQCWVLKCPSHLPHLQLLQKHFPCARFVWTHRQMDSVISSFCRLSSVFAVAHLAELTPGQMGQHMLNYYNQMVHKGMKQREEIVLRNNNNDNDDDDRFVDIQFQDLVKDPLQQVKTIYDRFGLNFTTEYETKLMEYLKEDTIKRNALAKEREHNQQQQSSSSFTNNKKPTLEEYGIDKKLVDDMFATYHDQYLRC